MTIIAKVAQFVSHRTSIKHLVVTKGLRAMGTIAPTLCINLLRGWPSPSLLPGAKLQRAAETALSDPSISTTALLYGPDDGYMPLRQGILKWLSSFYSCPDDPSRICITGGASQNLACALQVYTDPGITAAVWMVVPCYFLACRIFEDAGFAGRLRAVREDEEGIDVDYLESEIVKMGKEGSLGKAKSSSAVAAMPPTFPSPESKNIGSTLLKRKKVLKPPRPWSKTYDHIIYAVPNFSNPSGKTMSLRRRTQLVHLARRHNALIITDDVYDRLQWPTDATLSSTNTTSLYPSTAILPRLTDIDHTLPAISSDSKQFRHTMSNGSFSKILGPGVRTGWADASPTFSYGLSQCGSSRSGGCPSHLVATIIAELLHDGSLEDHIISVLIPSYAQRWTKMMNAIETHLVPLGVSVSKVSLEGKDVFGGYFIWFELPEGTSAAYVAKKAKENENLIVAHGDLFEVYSAEKTVRFKRWLRVCFAWEDEENLVEGIVRLEGVIRSGLGVNMDEGRERLQAEETSQTPLGAF